MLTVTAFTNASQENFSSPEKELKAARTTPVVVPFATALDCFVRWTRIEPGLGSHHRRLPIFLRVLAHYASHPDAGKVEFQLAMLQKHQRPGEPEWNDGNIGEMQVRRCRRRAVELDVAEHQDGNRKRFRLRVEMGRDLLSQAQERAELARRNVPKATEGSTSTESEPMAYRTGANGVPKPAPGDARNVPKAPALRLPIQGTKLIQEREELPGNGGGKQQEETRPGAPPETRTPSRPARVSRDSEQETETRLLQEAEAKGFKLAPNQKRRWDIRDALRDGLTPDELSTALSRTLKNRWAQENGYWGDPVKHAVKHARGYLDEAAGHRLGSQAARVDAQVRDRLARAAKMREAAGMPPETPAERIERLSGEQWMKVGAL